MKKKISQFKEKYVKKEWKSKVKDIAIIGIGCRFPDAANYDEYWENLENGRFSIKEIPGDRWKYGEFTELPEGYKSKSVSKWGGFINQVDTFDTRFFGLSNREVDAMDPQQRIMLELTWSCLEDAGICPSSVSGDNIGVYIGAFNHDFKELIERGQEKIVPHHSTGTASTIIPNRISYYFNLKGPSLEIDNACSGSLSALHTACQSIINEDCKMALAGGINILLSPTRQISFSQMGMLSPSGKCKTFDKDADGYVRGEGAGIVLLKSLHKALEDGDTIHGIIKGSAINHSGKVRTLTYPSSDAQASVITQAIKRAGVELESINYIEAHGTGTPKGDPIEFEGLTKAFNSLSTNNESKINYCGIGTVKTNIGHLEAAAGIAGVIKVLMAMKNKKLPGILNFNQLNPKISPHNTPFFIIDQLQEWKQINNKGVNTPRRAGVSSFGFGGTNGHVILEEPPVVRETRKHSRSYHFLTLSAKTDESLKQRVIDLHNWIEKNNDAEIADISTSLLLGREHFQKRIAIISDNLVDLNKKLLAVLENKNIDSVKGEVLKKEDFPPSVYSEFRKVSESIKQTKNFYTMEYREKLIQLADFYVKGFSIEWNQILNITGRRINLPTYPFIKERCWMPEVYVKADGSSLTNEYRSASSAGIIHPLVHENTSDFSGQRFSSIFTGTEDFIHSVNENNHYLSELAHLEMIRVAAKRSMSVTKDSILVLKDVEWIEPMLIDKNTMVHMALYPSANGDFEWELYAQNEGSEEEPVVNSEGKVSMKETMEAGTSLHDLRTYFQRQHNNDKASEIMEKYIEAIWSNHDEDRKLLVRFKHIEEKSNKGYKELEMLDAGMLEACLEMVNVYLANRKNPNRLLSMKKIEIPAQAGQPVWGIIGMKNSDRDVVSDLDIVLYDESEKVVAAITGLKFDTRDMEEYRQVEQKPVSIEQNEMMTFEETWQESALTLKEKTLRTLVIFVTDENRRQMIEKSIKQLSPDTEIIFIGCGKSYTKESTNLYTVNSRDKSGYVTSFKKIKASVGNVDAVLYMWPTEDGEWITDPTGILYMLQGMAEARVKTERILITGGYKDELERCHIESWIGIGRSTGLVMPGTKVNIVFANRKETKSVEWAERMWKELHTEKAESVWYEGNDRKITRINPIQLKKEASNVPLKKGGVYLLTGGVGGLGMIFSRWLAEKYHAKLILINRSSLESKRDKLQELRDIGAEVVYFSADVCDSEQLKRAVQAGKERFGKIDGVIHAAGIEGKGSILEKSVEDYLRCLGPKVQGTLSLEEALQGEKLDFMCYFSSSSAILGDFGNGDYAVGNRFLMSYGMYRNKAGYTGKTVVINWPLWKSEGMGFADEEGSKMYLKSSGQRFIESEEGTEIFEELLQQTNIQHLVMTGNKERICKFLGLVEKSEVVVKEEQEKKKVMVLPGKGRQLEMKGWTIEQCLLWELKDTISNILKIPKEKLGIEENLADFGFDSVSLGEFAGELSDRYKIDITPDLFFGYPTMERLSNYLLDRYGVQMNEFYRDGEELPVEAEEVSFAFGGVAATVEKSARSKEKKIRSKNFGEKTRSLSREEPIAIIGMSGRFPESRSINELWSILVEGKEVIRKVSHERTEWAVADGIDKKFGVMPGMAEFDPLFFEISPREAVHMDPRQRILLQETWKALEDAGYGSKSFENEKVGIFVGIEEGDYKIIAGDEGGITSNHNAILAARLSYFLNLDGPNMAINTACSSGLVAVHQACQSLRNGECDTAIVAGINLMITPDLYTSMIKAGMLSEDGKCYAFDKRANGMVPAEAIGVVVLKRLSKAEEDRNPIYANIVGNGINYDGKTNGITAPSGSSQSRLIREVYNHFKINPKDMEYIVTHGTGTRLGDPVEINALIEAFKDFTEENSYCALTSVKPNIGHTLAASGIVSLISAVMALKHETIPASINCEQLNDYIHWENSPFYVNRENREWKDRDGKKRLSAVSSFGMSGTNAHVVVQSYIPEEKEKNCQTKQKVIPYYLLAISAKTSEALQQKIHDIKVMFEQNQDMRSSEMANISYTLMEGRQHFQHRCAVVIKDAQEAFQVFRQVEKDGITPSFFKGIVTRDFTSQAAISRTIEDLIEECINMEDDSKAYKENLYALAEYYCLGYEVSCEEILSNVKLTKVNLPTYSFVRQNYWVEKAEVSKTISQSKIGIIHPLLHQNVSSLSRQCYRTNFEDYQDYLSNLMDNVVFGKSKGVHLEMARMALIDAGSDFVEETAGITLQDIKWFDNNSDVNQGEVYTEVYLEDDKTLAYEIYSKNEKEQSVYCQGKGSFTQKNVVDYLDIKNIKENCDRGILNSNEYYRILEAAEIDNSRFSGIKKLYMGEKIVLAKVEMSTNESEPMNLYMLHPKLIDSALQSVIGLTLHHNKSHDIITVRKPVGKALKELEIISAYVSKMWIYISLHEDSHNSILESPQKVDIVLCDDEGKICVKLNNYTYTLSEEYQVKTSDDENKINIASMSRNKHYARLNESKENVIMIPRWNEILMETKGGLPYNRDILITGGTEEVRTEFLRSCPKGAIWNIGSGEYSIDEMVDSLIVYENLNHIVWIDPLHETKSVIDEEIVKEQEFGVLFLFKMIKALHKLGYADKELELTFITYKSLPVLEDDVVNPTHTGVHGLVGSVAKEFPNWSVRLIDLGTTQNWPISRILSIPPNIEGNAVASRGNKWYTMELVDYRETIHPTVSQNTIYRKGGVYVVIGGAGGIGELWSEYMIRNFQAKIIWIGRSKKNKEIDEKIKRLSLIGQEPYYLSADATNLDSMKSVYKEIKKKYPFVNGMVHSAVGILDKSISEMDIDMYKTIIGVKINASVHMAMVFENEPLDLILYFSSVASFSKLGGQSGYATGCTFKDGFAQRLSKEMSCKVKTINWGYWGNVGVGESLSEAYKIRLSMSGMSPIEPIEAMGNLDSILCYPESQILYMRHDKSKANTMVEGRIIDSSSKEIPYQESKQEKNSTVNDYLLLEKSTTYIKKLVGEALKIPHQQLDTREELEKYGIDSIMVKHLTYSFRKVFKNIDSTLFFECKSIDELVEYLISNQKEVFMNLFEISEEKLVNLNGSSTKNVDNSKADNLKSKKFGKINFLNQDSYRKYQENVNTDMPIAIIGMSGRVPGANDLDEYWENLKAGKDSITEIPQDRWSLDEFYVSDVKKALEQRKSYCKWGGFIDGFTEFDPLFFKISPREAINMDPQERLILQECWRTFEDAGYSRERIKRQHKGNVGVFIGITRTGFDLYGPDIWRQEERIHPSTSFSSVANRISYIFDLQGPSLPIDTMCSSSLSAIHEACENIRRGHCEMAVAGGVNVYTHPSTYVLLCEKNMLSKDGRCKSFGKEANGFVPGEGVGVILLKPLSKAIQDGDNICAVIRGTSINHGGKTNGYTVPNPKAQAKLVRDALDKAGVNARVVSYIEAHGTGTELGDPIEIAGLSHAFRSDTDDLQFCAIGSAKSNIGHLEGAAGIAGVMKTILQMKHGQIAPSLNADELNPYIDFEKSPFYVQRELKEWNRPVIEQNGIKKEYPRIAGVSSFGAGGSNAHVVIEEYEM
ncbi:SDR family NAD(P)-dependent oxidoreductase [Niallia sp. HCP3S3_B10]|uniref:SDR family NAD(P)-dependent oxidoreductase n=1 Tax=Niallia sp. HCP3S3_B10 TaxID=3438944 RepID=UPI003F8BD68D